MAKGIEKMIAETFLAMAEGLETGSFGKRPKIALTGMGSDGASGMTEIKKTGGYVIAESEETAIVYGMPKVVVDLGLADEVKPLQNIAGAIVNAVNH